MERHYNRKVIIVNKSFFDFGVYVLLGFALSQAMYAFMYNLQVGFAAASLSATTALAVIIFDLAGRNKAK
jgi:hypothetical protein